MATDLVATDLASPTALSPRSAVDDDDSARTTPSGAHVES